MFKYQNTKLWLIVAVVAGLLCLCGCGAKHKTESDNDVLLHNSGNVTQGSNDVTYENSDSSDTEQVSEELVIKDYADPEDLMRNETFYACVPKNRYGGNCEEGDYAAGEFILWLHKVTLSESGDIIGRDKLIVPYIVSYEDANGNPENLSMLSGGWDGDEPYGDAILEITTNENGEIIDAVFL